MAVLGRVLFSSAERVDLPDLLSIDSYAAGDWKYYIQSVVGTTKPYILYGFDVINPQNAIGLPTCSIRVANSVVYYPGSSASPFFYGLPDGNTNSVPLVPQLRTNTVNYVYLTLSAFNTAEDTRALWDPDRNGGVGEEFTQDLNTESAVQVQVNVSTGSFPSNVVPVAIITVGPSAITSIQDARDLLFRLGTGGLNPNPFNTFAFRNLPSSSYEREEPETTVGNISDPNSFQGGDKNIYTMKEWMDVVMTKLRELGGTKYWYEQTDTFSLINLFHDALTTTWKSKGQYNHSSNTPGQLSWTEDIYVKSTSSPKDLVIRASGGSPLNIGNEQVAFINLIRNQPINTLDQPVAWTNGQAYVNTIGGSVGLFQNLKKGDWVKKASDTEVLFLQVREFYNTTQSPGPVSGSTTTAGNARAITLSAAYQGTTSPLIGDVTHYDRGEYQPTDIQVLNRSDSTFTNVGGDELWFAVRSDTIDYIGTVQSFEVDGTITVADGVAATVSATTHGLSTNDLVTVTAPGPQAGTYSIQVVDANTFNFKTTNTTTGAFVGRYGLCTTTAFSVNGFQIESANHGFETGETVVVSGTTNFNGTYVVSIRSNTQFEFAIGTVHGVETVGNATLARLDVRSEEGITKIIQGETIDVGSGVIENMQAFIGMDNIAETYPAYVLPAGYNAKNDQANFNALATDNLTARVSKLSAMMGDKAQDKTIKCLTNAIEASNTTDGISPTLQDLFFSPPSSSLTILEPGSVGNAVVTLPSSGSPIQLAANQVAYVSINRNASSTPGITIAAATSVPFNENIFVIAARLSDNYVYLWNGEAILNTTPLVPTDPPLIQVTYCDPISTTLPTGNPVTEDGLSVNAGETVLFTHLGSGANEVYQAVGVGTNITSWSALYKFHGNLLPSLGDTVLVLKGNAFAIQTGKFNGTSWVFNDKVRYFNGGDYWEQSNIVSAALSDNTSANLFSVAWANNEHIIVDYSIVRSTLRETGTMHIVTDGSSVTVTTDSAYVNGNSGVTFTGLISGPNLVIQYSTTATSQSATMKYSMKRWSTGTGGPGGIPSYTGAAPAPTAAAGPVNAIQFNTGGFMAGNANFEIDTVDLSVNYNGLRQGVLSSGITILNNQPSATNLFALPNTYPYMVLDYSVSKETFARVGRLLVAYDGTNVVCNDAFVETGVTGITLQAIVSGPNIQFQYTSSNGSGNGTFKYSWRKWS